MGESGGHKIRQKTVNRQMRLRKGWSEVNALRVNDGGVRVCTHANAFAASGLNIVHEGI